MNHDLLPDFIELARQHGLTLAPESLRLNESGLDFKVAYARDPEGTVWVLRQPRRPDVIASAAREARMLKVLAPVLPVSVPDWRIHSETLIAYPRLDGEPAGVIDPAIGNYVWSIDPQALPEAFIKSLAKALVALHSTPPETLADTGAPIQTPTQVRKTLAQEMILSRELLTVPEQVWDRWQRWLANDKLWPEACTPIHGDMHPGHQLLNSSHQLTGLIDWTEAAVGDPALDLVAHCGCFGEPALQELLTQYQQAGGTVWPGMFEHILARWSAWPVIFATFARTSGQHDYLGAAQYLLDAQVSA